MRPGVRGPGRLRKFFFDGDETSWIGDLEGSEDALNGFLECAARLNNNNKPQHATQPFGKASQPY